MQRRERYSDCGETGSKDRSQLETHVMASVGDGGVYDGKRGGGGEAERKEFHGNNIPLVVSIVSTGDRRTFPAMTLLRDAPSRLLFSVIVQTTTDDANDWVRKFPLERFYFAAYR